MKRVSLFWPLVLIAVGALWLLGNMGVISSANFWALTRLWPVLLIGLGIGLILRSWWAPAWNIISFLTVAVVVLGVIFAPQLGLSSSRGFWSRSITLSGETVTEKRSVSDFQAVSIEYPSEVVVRQGEVESLTIEADKNVLENIRTQVSGGTLRIESKDDWFPFFNLPGPVRITLTVVNLESLRLSSAGSIRMDELKTDRLEVAMSGAGDMDLGNLEAGRFTGSISGTGNITVAGKVDDLVIQISGLGSYHGKNLQSNTAEVRISGAGSAEVWVEEDLEANISGAGSVDYYGNPTVSKQISGAGSVTKKGDK